MSAEKAPPSGEAFIYRMGFGLVAAAAGRATAGTNVRTRRAEGVTASARALGVGVGKGEALTHEAIDVVDLRAAEHARAHSVQEDAHAVALHDQVLAGLIRLVEDHAVGHAGATAALHEHAQVLLPGQTLALEKLRHLLGGRGSQHQLSAGSGYRHFVQFLAD